MSCFADGVDRIPHSKGAQDANIDKTLLNKFPVQFLNCWSMLYDESICIEYAA